MLIKMTGSDTQMDAKLWTEPLNAIPPKCSACGFPDIDAVPQPYYISQSRAKSSNDVAPAHLGNFFVTPRAHAVLGSACPGACRYYATQFHKSNAPTGWLLAVPTKLIVTGEVKAEISRCAVCGEPASAHPGTQYQHNDLARNWKHADDGDIFKSKNWGSSDSAWSQWMVRDLIFSVRLYQLFKKLKIKGFYEAQCYGETPPSPDDKIWIAGQISRLEQSGIDFAAPAKSSPADARWFNQYLKEHSTETGLSAKAFAPIEKRYEIAIPKSIQKFLTKVGSQSFHDVDEEEGAVVTILPLDEWNFESYRTAQLTSEDDIADGIDAIMFAGTNFGDCFCFDLSQTRPEPPVLRYLHEGGYFEPYTSGFTECLRRFAETTQVTDDALN